MSRSDDKEEEKMHFQMDRFTCQNGEWFYTTREGEERGPFDSKQEAEGDLTAYVSDKKKLESFGIK